MCLSVYFFVSASFIVHSAPIRASPAGRRILPMQTICPGPFASAHRQKMVRGPAGLGSAPTGSTHIVRARVLLDRP
jgi:hypothetical protein